MKEQHDSSGSLDPGAACNSCRPDAEAPKLEHDTAFQGLDLNQLECLMPTYWLSTDGYRFEIRGSKNMMFAQIIDNYRWQGRGHFGRQEISGDISGLMYHA